MRKGLSHFRARHRMLFPIPYIPLVPSLFYLAFLGTSHVFVLHPGGRGTGRCNMLSRTPLGVAQLFSPYAVPSSPRALSMSG